jgi:hypothetical protein
MGSSCSFGLDQYGVSKTTDLFTTAFVEKFTAHAWDGLAPWYCLYAENSIDLTSVTRKTGTPFYWVVGEKDELVDAAGARQMFDTLCTAGYAMDFLECKGAGHSEAGLSSMKEQIAWVRDRFDGKPLTNPCVKSDPVCCSGATNADCPGQ